MATVIVGWGILWEAPEQPPHRHKIAKHLVIWGIIFESLCSIILFRYDESISHTQQSQIIALGKTSKDQKDTIIRLQGTAATEQARLILLQSNSQAQQSKIIYLESRLVARSLSYDQLKNILSRIKPFAHQQFAVITYPDNPEAYQLAVQIYETVNGAGWAYKPYPGVLVGVTTGVVVLFDNRVPKIEQAADALVKALNAEGVVSAIHKGNPPPSEAINPRISIEVGIRP